MSSTTDAATIVWLLRLRPGSIVAESGTGSGVLSSFIARRIAGGDPPGALHTFDFHAERSAEAAADFAKHKLQGTIHSHVGDVCGEGFALESESVDAVILDVPAPWNAIPHAARILRPGGRLVSFFYQ